MLVVAACSILRGDLLVAYRFHASLLQALEGYLVSSKNVVSIK
jgi:hypothetical protein